MAFDQRLLLEDEEVLLDLRPHWWTLLPQIATVIASLVVGVLVVRFTDHIYLRYAAATVLVAALGWFGLRWLKWNATNFVVTTERLIDRSGVVAKEGKEIPLERINTVDFNQSVFDRLVGRGDLSVESAGEGGRQEFHNVWRPNQVQQQIYRAMEINEQNRHESMAHAQRDLSISAREPSIPEQIEKLDELRIKGILTDREFQEKKADLLDRL